MTQDISSDLLNKNGVYKITNIIKDRFYIGSTSQGFLKRFKQHLYILKKEYPKQWKKEEILNQ